MNTSIAPVRIYTIDISLPMEKFELYQQHYLLSGIPEQLIQAYVASLIEQIIAHFEVQSTAVQSFTAHYTRLITERLSPTYQFHPLKYLREMDIDGYQGYVFCLAGLAEEIFGLFVQHGMFDANGKLRASYQRLIHGSLDLIVRPEVPDVFLY